MCRFAHFVHTNEDMRERKLSTGYDTKVITAEEKVRMREKHQHPMWFFEREREKGIRVISSPLPPIIGHLRTKTRPQQHSDHSIRQAVIVSSTHSLLQQHSFFLITFYHWEARGMLMVVRMF